MKEMRSKVSFAAAKVSQRASADLKAVKVDGPMVSFVEIQNIKRSANPLHAGVSRREKADAASPASPRKSE